MLIAVLDLTSHPLPLLDGMPRVARQIIDWLRPALPEARFFAVDVADGGDPMPGLDTFDGLIVSGSEFGVYDDLPWMEPLRQLLRDTRDAGKPVYGICFGHQIMADTFGGRAEKAAVGKRIGAEPYDLGGMPTDVYVWHQDQVTMVPPGAAVTASGAACPVGALVYDFPAMSVQYHPEYTEPHLRLLFDIFRGSEVSESEFKAATASFETASVPMDLAAAQAAAFFRGQT